MQGRAICHFAKRPWRGQLVACLEVQGRTALVILAAWPAPPSPRTIRTDVRILVRMVVTVTSCFSRALRAPATIRTFGHQGVRILSHVVGLESFNEQVDFPAVRRGNPGPRTRTPRPTSGTFRRHPSEGQRPHRQRRTAQCGGRHSGTWKDITGPPPPAGACPKLTRVCGQLAARLAEHFSP